MCSKVSFTARVHSASFIIYAIFLLYPTFSGMFYSLTDWNGLNRDYSFIGLGNFVELFKEDPDFLNSLWFTLKYVIFMLILQNVIALMLAVFIESRTRSKGLFRTLFFMPNMISTIISAFMWTFIFSQVLPQLAEKLAVFSTNNGSVIRSSPSTRF